MANSIYEATGDGSTTDFTIPYTYLEADDVTAFVDGVSTSFTFTSDNIITFATAPANGTSVRILRNTDVVSLNVTYSDGGALTAQQLNDSNKQLLFGVQEAIDTANEAIILDNDGKFQGQVSGTNRVIKNVADPVNDQDVVTKSFISTNLPNITTVAGIEASVTTIANNVADVVTVADNLNGTDTVGTVAASIIDVNTVAARDADIATVAARDTDIGTVALRDTDIGTVASRDTEIGRLGTTATVADMSVLGTAGSVSNISTLAGISTDITTVAGKAPLITSDFVADLNTVAVTDVINDINTLATSDIVADLNTLASTDIVADLNTLATTDIVSDINTLATTDIVNDLNLLATSDFVADLNTMATTANVTNLSTVATNISDVSTAASSISEITSFNELFSVGAAAPTSPSAGDLWYDTANSQLKVYVSGSGWQVAGAYLQGLTSTHVFTCTANQTALTTDDDGNALSIYSNGNTLVFMNGIRLVEGSGSGVNDYYISGNTINLNSNSDAGDIVLVEVFTKISTTQEASLNSLVSQASTSASNAATSESNAATSESNAATSAANSATSASSSSTSAATSTAQASAASTSASNAATSESNAAASATSAASSAAAAQAAANFEVVNDTTPSLGGDLDVSGNSIVSVSNGNIAITPNGTGSVVIDGLSHPQSDGTSGQFMKTDGAGNLSFATVDLTAINVSDDSTPSLGGDLDTNGNSILFGSSAWSIELDSGDNDLLFKYNGTTVFKLASNGAVTSANDVTAFGSP